MFVYHRIRICYNFGFSCLRWVALPLPLDLWIYHLTNLYSDVFLGSHNTDKSRPNETQRYDPESDTMEQ